MIIAGIDYSMTSPGMTIADTKKPFVFQNVHMFYLTDKTSLAKSFGNVHGFKYPEWTCPEERYFKVASQFMEIMKKLGVEQVMIESYSYGSVGNTLNLAENMSVLKLMLWQAGVRYHTMAPSSVKKMATGNGRADKAEMIKKFYETSGCTKTINEVIGLKSDKIDTKPIDDLIDSWHLAKAFYDSNLWKTE